jgi:membrane carboxypeptidase/penicillin-binding protein
MEFGLYSQLVVAGHPSVSVKTGTTNDIRDNWTMGYTPSYVVGVWVGNNDNTPMSKVASGITGAAPIWNDIMSHLLEGKVPQPLSRPPGIVQKAVCSDTGLPTTTAGATCPTRFEYILKGTENTHGQITTGDTQIDSTTQDLPAKGQTTNLTTKTETVYTDPTGDRFCMTCPHPELMPSPTPTPAP